MGTDLRKRDRDVENLWRVGISLDGHVDRLGHAKPDSAL